MSKEHFQPTSWATMPFAVRKAWLRFSRAVPAYDLTLTQGWELFQALADKPHIYATNRSGEWYVAKTERPFA